MWLAHAMTLLRLPLAALFWLAIADPRWALAVLAVAAATDLADGRLARRARARGAKGPSARIGAWLDPLCDKLFAVIVLAALALRLGTPVGLLLLIGARELVMVPVVIVYLVTPLRRRFRFELRASPAGKVATAAQFVAVAAILVRAPGIFGVALLTAALGWFAATRYLARAAHRMQQPGAGVRDR